MHKWQLTNVMVTLPLPLLSSCCSPPSHLLLLLIYFSLVSLSHSYSLCRLVALYKRQSGQRAGNCFHICDNHQHLHRSAATPAKQPRQQQQQQLQHEAVNPRLPLSASAAQDAAACTAAAAVSVHLVVDPATFSCSMPHAACNNQLCPLVLLNERCRRRCRRRRGATLTWLTHLAEDDRA